MSITRSILITTTYLFIAGCSSSPFLKDVTNNPDRVDLADKDQALQISYLARFLMEADDRAKLEVELSNSELVERWGASKYSTLTSMGADVHARQLGSASGKALGNSVFVAGIVLGEIFDGQYDQIGQVFLPGKIDSLELGTREQAEQALSELLQRKIVQFAENYGYSVSCIETCDSLNQIFLLSTEKPQHQSFIYWPSEIAISTYVKGLVKAGPDRVRDAIVGFPVAWQSGSGETLLVTTYGDPSRDDAGNIKIRERDYRFVGFGRDLLDTKIGREIRRSIFDNPYLILGDSDIPLCQDTCRVI